MTPEPEKLFVLSYRYSDGSGYVVLRAYATLARALEDQRLVEEAGGSMKEFRVSRVEHLPEGRE